MALYSVRIFGSYGGPSGKDEFSNTYEVQTDEALDSGKLENAALALMDFHRKLSCATLFISRATISTYEKDSGTGQDTFRTVPYGQAGLFPDDANSDIMPPEIVLVLNLQTGIGRTGKKYLRGFANNQYIFFRGGTVGLVPAFEPNNFTPAVTALTNALITADVSLVVIRKYQGGQTVKIVDAIQLGGVSFRQRDRRTKAKIARNEAGLLAQLGDAVELLGVIGAGVTVLSAGGKILSAARVAAKLLQLTAAAGRVPQLPPPPQAI